MKSEHFISSIWVLAGVGASQLYHADDSPQTPSAVSGFLPLRTGKGSKTGVKVNIRPRKIGFAK